MVDIVETQQDTFDFGALALESSGAQPTGDGNTTPDLTTDLTSKLAEQAQVIETLRQQASSNVVSGLSTDELADNRDLIPVVTKIAQGVLDTQVRLALADVTSAIESLKARLTALEQGTEQTVRQQQQRERNTLSTAVNRAVEERTGVAGIIARIDKTGELYAKYSAFCAQYVDAYKTRTNIDVIRDAVNNLDARTVSDVLVSFVKSMQAAQGGHQQADTAASVVVQTGSAEESHTEPEAPTPQAVEKAAEEYSRIVDLVSRKRISQSEFDRRYAPLADILGLK